MIFTIVEHDSYTSRQRGYYQLDSKVTATQQAIYYFQGQLQQGNASHDPGEISSDNLSSYRSLRPDWPRLRCRLHVRSRPIERDSPLTFYASYRDSFDLASTVIAPCGANTVLNIVSSLQVSNSANKSGSGYIATDSVDTTLKQTFGTSRVHG